MPKEKSLIDDILPVPVKERSELGKVTISLDGQDEITLVGVVYGLEHVVRGEGFEAKLFLDHYNQRIRILEYQATDYEAMILRIRALSEKNGFDKIICIARRKDWQQFLRHGYVLEAVLKYFYDREDGFIVSKFRSQERLYSPNLMEEILLIEKIMASERVVKSRGLVADCELRLARTEDIPELIKLYRSIFATYPSPLLYEHYLSTVFSKENLFAVVTRGKQIVAAASAELNPPQKAAELTDCATLPSERGAGHMSVILKFLENEIRGRGYRCAYTLARSRSFGMNQVFYRLNYEFLGRLVNNCDIYGTYEDMNLWVKDLTDSPEHTLS